MTITETEALTGLCTCCPEPRPATFDEPCGEWVHDTEDAAEMFHVHEDTRGCDCDGQLDRSTIYRIPSLRWDESWLSRYNGHVTPPDRHDLWRRMVQRSIPTGPCQASIEALDDAGHLLRMSWYERTDEGSNSGQITGCDDPTCAHDRDSQRDLYAERMGY